MSKESHGWNKTIPESSLMQAAKMVGPKTGDPMKLTRNTIAILALASFTFAFAEDTGMGAKHHEASAAESQEMKDCESCKGWRSTRARAGSGMPWGSPPPCRSTWRASPWNEDGRGYILVEPPGWRPVG